MNFKGQRKCVLFFLKSEKIKKLVGPLKIYSIIFFFFKYPGPMEAMMWPWVPLLPPYHSRPSRQLLGWG